MSALGGGASAITCQLAHTSVLSALLSYLRSLRRSYFPPSSDEQDELTYDEIYAAWDVRQLEHQYDVQHCERCFAQGTVEPPRAEQEP